MICNKRLFNTTDNYIITQLSEYVYPLLFIKNVHVWAKKYILGIKSKGNHFQLDCFTKSFQANRIGSAVLRHNKIKREAINCNVSNVNYSNYDTPSTRLRFMYKYFQEKMKCTGKIEFNIALNVIKKLVECGWINNDIDKHMKIFYDISLDCAEKKIIRKLLESDIEIREELINCYLSNDPSVKSNFYVQIATINCMFVDSGELRVSVLPWFLEYYILELITEDEYDLDILNTDELLDFTVENESINGSVVDLDDFEVVNTDVKNFDYTEFFEYNGVLKRVNSCEIDSLNHKKLKLN